MQNNAETVALDPVGLAEDRATIQAALRTIFNTLDRHYTRRGHEKIDAAYEGLALAARDLSAALRPQHNDGTVE